MGTPADYDDDDADADADGSTDRREGWNSYVDIEQKVVESCKFIVLDGAQPISITLILLSITLFSSRYSDYLY